MGLPRTEEMPSISAADLGGSHGVAPPEGRVLAKSTSDLGKVDADVEHVVAVSVGVGSVVSVGDGGVAAGDSLVDDIVGARQ